MTVVFAYYGLTCALGDLNQVNQHRSTNWVAGLCNGRTHCSGVVHVSTLTDPYIGCGKDFIAVAHCSNGHVIADHVRPEANTQRFSLACN